MEGQALVAIDVGYGDVKWATGGKRGKFPSRYASHRKANWGIGSGGASVLMVDGEGPFAFGEDASGLPGCREPQHDGRLADPATLPLLAAALFSALPEGGEVCLASGLPLGTYDREAEAAKAYLRGREIRVSAGKREMTYTIRRVVLRPQGVGAALYLAARGLLPRGDGSLLVVDVGSRTTDCLTLRARNLEPVMELSGSLQTGIGDAAAGLAGEIAGGMGFVPPLAVAQEALATEVVYGGARYGGPAAAKPHLVTLANTIRDGVRAYLRGSLSQVAAVALVGGGAALLGDRLTLPGAPVKVPPRDAAYANCLGYLVAAGGRCP